MSHMLPFPHEGRLREEDSTSSNKASDRRVTQAATREGQASTTEFQIPDAAAQALSGAVMARRHIVFPDPVAFR
jgi:hypothetical protein